LRHAAVRLEQLNNHHADGVVGRASGCPAPGPRSGVKE
jgi:hypothetical protein